MTPFEDSDGDELTLAMRDLFPTGSIDRVLLVSPPDVIETDNLFNLTFAKQRRYANLPPYGLGVLATQLRGIGVEVRIRNLNHYIYKMAQEWDVSVPFEHTRLWSERLKRAIEEFEPDMIGLTCMFTMTHNSLKHVSQFVRQNYSIPLVLGGVHITNSTDRIIADIPEADCLFLRESDTSLPRFVEFVEGARDISELSQLFISTVISLTFDRRFSGWLRITRTQVEYVHIVRLLTTAFGEFFYRLGRTIGWYCIFRFKGFG